MSRTPVVTGITVTSVTVASITVALCLVTAVLIWNLDTAGHAPVNSLAEEHSELREELAELRDSHRRLQREFEMAKQELRELAALASVNDTTLSALLAASEDETTTEPTSTPNDTQQPRDEDARSPKDIVHAAYESLVEDGAEWEDWVETWTDLGKRGLIDDALALFEENARENPDDPDAHTHLGHAYIQKLMSSNEANKWQWSVKGIESYSQALEIDDHHWDARFSKAMNLSFAPPVFGLQAKAIDEFETLRSQQREAPRSDKFIETYKMLGNLYRSQGKSEKAGEVWQEGLSLFPNHAELQANVNGLAKQ